MKHIAHILRVGTAIGAAVCAYPAAAQSAGSAGGSGSEVDQANADIIVTAQKRAQKLSDVGMTITAATGAQLATRGVTTVNDLVKIEPALQYTKSNNGLPVYTIRGVGFYDQSLASAATVSLYLDEAPYAFAALSKGALLDVDRVEVLKGPQGTLYGQNATGGAINFIAARPTPEFSAGISGTYARFGEANVEAFVSGPITSTLGFRLAGNIQEGGAWQQSNTRNDMLGNRNFKTGRLLLDWNPTSDLKIKLNINGFTDDSDSQAAQLEGFRFGNPSYISSKTAAYLATHPLAYLPDQADYATYPDAIKAQLVNPIAPNNDRAADWVAGTHPKDRERYFEPTLRVDYDPSPAFGVTSITKYEHYNQNNVQDIGGINVLETVVDTIGRVRSFSQELRAHGSFAASKADWLIGLNYSNDRGHELEDTAEATSGTYLTGGSIYSPLPFGGNFNQFGAIHDSRTTSRSVFANLNYRFTDQITIHAGARYTSATETASSCSTTTSTALDTFLAIVSTELTGTPQPTVAPGACNSFLPNNTQGLYSTRQKEHNVPFRFGVDWKPSRDVLLYGTISRGYKAGGSPALAAASWVQLQPIKQEQLVAYEAGIKAQAFDHTLDFTGAVFHYDYKNKQLLGRTLDPLGLFGALTALVNIPKSVETGAEAAVTWRPTRGLSLNAAGVFLNTKVTSNFINYSVYPASPSDTINFKGERFPFAPKWSVSYGARYDWRLSASLKAFVGANATYQSKTNAAFGTAQADAVGPSFDLKGYSLLDLAAGIETDKGRLKVQVFGKNVTNTYYWTNVFYTFDNTVRYAGRPATYGLTVAYRY